MLPAVTRCAECGYDWAGEPAVDAIATFHGDVCRLLTGIADASPRLRTRPAATTWSPLEYLAHTGDAIDWYGRRVDRVLTEHRPALQPFDWDAHTAGQRYHERRLDDVLGDVARSCTRFTSRLAGLTAHDWARQGSGSDGRPRTVTQLVHRAAHEARHHLHDIRAGLTRTT